MGFQKQNRERMAVASKKVSSKYRKRRQILRQQRKSKSADTINYCSGAFSNKPVKDKTVFDASEPETFIPLMTVVHDVVEFHDSIDICFIDENEDVIFLSD